jgi:hypothetical protein
LPVEARSIWNGPATSPPPGFLAFCLVPLGFTALPRCWAILRRQTPAPSLSGSLLDLLLIIYAAGMSLALRLVELFVFFLALWGLRLPGKQARAAFFVALLAVVAGLEGLKSLAPSSRFNPFITLAAAFPQDEGRPATSFRNELEVIRWLKAHGGPNAPALVDIAFSAGFLTYAGTPALIHPKFEAAGIRAKVAEYVKALYENEDAFYGFCRKYGARYFVLTVYDVLDETPDGERYQSGSLRLTPDSAAVLMQFHPERLKHFHLALENEDFRIYAVDGPPAKLPAASPAVYDITQYAPQVMPDGALKLDVPSVLARMKESRDKLFIARVLLRGRMPEPALEYYEKSFAAWPPDESTRREYERLRRALEPAAR